MSLLYGDLCKQFHKRWAPEKGQCPPIRTILQIVNPALSLKFEAYLKNLPWRYRNIEQYFHGTKLNCDIYKYMEICTYQCGVCGIARKGFDPQQIRRNRFQRFGPGFYLAPNSSKCHDYPLGSDASPGGYKSMLLCKVAPGKKYSLRHNEISLNGPPKGCHSVYGKSKTSGVFQKSGDLNYDEIVVYDSDAICPLYIFIYQ